eukprot:99698-Alexandrium_andersonii.AAC.1
MPMPIRSSICSAFRADLGSDPPMPDSSDSAYAMLRSDTSTAQVPSRGVSATGGDLLPRLIDTNDSLSNLRVPTLPILIFVIFR